MTAATIINPETKEKSGETEEKYPNYKVVLINDDVNSFQHVIQSLLKYIPGMSPEGAQKIANTVHTEGSAIVYSGVQEHCELYYEMLLKEKLTVKLEKE